jgi:nitrite reductase/ring-hydroxylating ferredoxin subunit
MEGFQKIGSLAEFPDRRPKNVVVEGFQVVVMKVDESVVAFDNNCPHQHLSLLHQGTVEGCSITCPMHGWSFDVKSGRSINGNGMLRMFEVKTAEGSVWIGGLKNDRSFTQSD